MRDRSKRKSAINYRARTLMSMARESDFDILAIWSREHVPNVAEPTNLQTDICAARHAVHEIGVRAAKRSRDDLRNGVREDNRPENLELWTRPPNRPDPGERCHHVSARNTCSVYGGFGHLQQCSRLSLSTLGGGGNRTRVLQCITRASPGAACCAFLSPGDHASKSPTGSAAVRCPA